MVADQRHAAGQGGQTPKTVPMTDTTPVARPVPDRPTRETFDLQHAAAYGAVALLLFSLLKAYASANFSLTTAAALLTTAPINVLLGTMVSYSYQVFPLLFIGFGGLAALMWHRT